MDTNQLDPYPIETLPENDDDGTMPANVEALREGVIGRRIVAAEKRDVTNSWGRTVPGFVLTLDNALEVQISDTDDCCAYTSLEEFWLDPASVDHVITGVGTTERFTTWHIYADMGDIMRLKVGWSCGNPFYYGYGFNITVQPATIVVDAPNAGRPAQFEVMP